MPLLSDNAVTWLGSATVNVVSGAGPSTIFTTPVGKVTRVVGILVRDPTASMAGGSAYTFGTGFRGNSAIDLSSLTTANTDYVYLDQNNVKSTEIAASTNFQITVGTGTTVACSATLDVFGFTT